MLGNQFTTKPATKLEVIFSKVEDIARNTKLVVRKSRRFTAAAFLLTLLKTVATGKASYNQMASTLGHCDLKPMSRQAFSQRMGEKSEHFIKETLSEAMVQKWGGKKIIKTQYFENPSRGL